MIIQSISLYRFSIPMHPFAIATGTMTEAQNMVVRMRDAQGHEGWGECSAFPYITGETQETCLAMGKLFGQFLVAQPDLSPNELSDRLRLVAAYNPTAKSAFDMAMYDLAARAAGKPLYAYLGGTQKQFVTDITVGIAEPEAMAAQAAAFIQNGATIIKVKVGKHASEDVQRIAAIRAAVGPEIVIRIDANQGYTLPQAIEALGQMEQYDVEFCEQPMERQTGDLQLAELQKHTRIPVMLDESVYHSADLLTLLPQRAHFHSINIKFAKCGGFTEAIRLATLAASQQIPCMMGGMLESRLAMTAFAHFAAAHAQVQFFDMDTALLGHKEDPIVGGATYGPGYTITLNDAAGLGCSVDPSFLSHCERLEFRR